MANEHMKRSSISYVIKEMQIKTAMRFYYLPVVSLSGMSDSFRPRELWHARLLCSWDFPGKNTRMALGGILEWQIGYHFLFQGILNPEHRWYHVLLKCTGSLIHGSWELKLLQSLWKSVWWSFIKLNIITIWASNCTPCYLPKKMKIYVHTETSTWMFTAALFMIRKTQKQQRCLAVSD